LGSVGLHILNLIKDIVTFPPYQYSVIISLILSDGYIQLKKDWRNAKPRSDGPQIHFEYLWSVFLILSSYCYSYPYFRYIICTGKPAHGITLETHALLCFNELHSLFYIDGIKIIPSDIFNLLTPPVLAHWIISDSSKHGNELIFCIDSFTVIEVIRLMNVFIIRYGLECTLHVRNSNHHRIYIQVKLMSLLRSIVLSYMHSSMLYKIHL